MSIKLKRVEKGLYHYEGSAIYPLLEVSNGYGWKVSNPNYDHSRDYVYESGFRNLKAVKEWLEGLDARVIEAAHAEALEEKADREYWANRRDEEKRLNSAVNWNDNREVEVGKKYKVVFPAMNKNNEVGEYKYLASLPQFDEDGKIWTHSREKGWYWHVPANWHVEETEIHSIVEMTAEEYDAFKVSLLSHVEWLGPNMGGHACDCFDEGWEYHKASEEERALFRAESYRVAVAVRAPGRETLIVDNSGYSYARYVGFLNL